MRTTIQVDDELASRLRPFVPERGFNRLVNELLQEWTAEQEKARLEEELKEGYLATWEDREQLNADWEVVDLEGWPEY